VLWRAESHANQTTSQGTLVPDSRATPEAAQPKPRPTLLLLKGSRVREYLQQNQRLLAALPGQAVRTRYNRTWVSDRVDLGRLEPGLPALVLFSDRPYETIAPARHARLLAARRMDDYLELDLRLEEFVAAEIAGTDLREHLGYDVDWPYEPFDDAGRKFFLDLSPAGWTLPRAASEDDTATIASWRRTIDFLTTSEEEREHYRHAVFFRPVELYRLGEGEAAHTVEQVPEGERRDLLDSAGAVFDQGGRYRLEVASYNPHLTAEELRFILEWLVEQVRRFDQSSGNAQFVLPPLASASRRTAPPPGWTAATPSTPGSPTSSTTSLPTPPPASAWRTACPPARTSGEGEIDCQPLLSLQAMP